MPESNEAPKEELKKGKSSKWYLVCLIIPLAIILIIGFLFLLYWLSNRNSNSNSTPTTSQTSNSGGQWTLDMTSTATMTGIETNLNSSGNGKVSFQMPSSEGGKFNGSGNWTSEGSGTVASTTSTSTINGKVNVVGEIKDSKLHLDVSYVEEACITTLNTPFGSSTNTNCDPNSIPDPHEINIDIKDGATAASDFNKDYNGYKFAWKENWALSSSK